MNDPSPEEVNRALDSCEAEVRAGRQLGPATVLWLIALARGGMWGRMAARATQERRTARLALRALLRAILDGSGLHWTAGHWRPILLVAADDTKDPDGPLPDASGLDVGPTVTPGERGPRLVEAHEHKPEPPDPRWR